MDRSVQKTWQKSKKTLKNILLKFETDFQIQNEYIFYIFTAKMTDWQVETKTYERALARAKIRNNSFMKIKRDF